MARPSDPDEMSDDDQDFEEEADEEASEEDYSDGGGAGPSKAKAKGKGKVRGGGKRKKRGAGFIDDAAEEDEDDNDEVHRMALPMQSSGACPVRLLPAIWCKLVSPSGQRSGCGCADRASGSMLCCVWCIPCTTADLRIGCHVQAIRDFTVPLSCNMQVPHTAQFQNPGWQLEPATSSSVNHVCNQGQRLSVKPWAKLVTSVCGRSSPHLILCARVAGQRWSCARQAPEA